MASKFGCGGLREVGVVGARKGKAGDSFFPRQRHRSKYDRVSFYGYGLAHLDLARLATYPTLRGGGKQARYVDEGLDLCPAGHQILMLYLIPELIEPCQNAWCGDSYARDVLDLITCDLL